MPHAASSAAPGLQALILCGPGSSFPTFTANPDENPKALLPIANRPMVWYPIDFCHRSGITDVTLICPPSASEALNVALSTNPYLTSPSVPRPDLLAPKGLDQNTGTAEILRLPEVRAVVKSDFVVLPCDLVCEAGGDKLLQAWMVKSASLSDLLRSSAKSGERLPSGGLGVWYPTKMDPPLRKLETDFIATVSLADSTGSAVGASVLSRVSKLVLSMPRDSLKDLTEAKNGFPIRRSLLQRHPRVRMRTGHRDAHIYIFPQWVMRLVQTNEVLETIGEDLIGLWAKASWQKGLSTKLNFRKAWSRYESEDGDFIPERIASLEKIDVESVRHTSLRAATPAGTNEAIESHMPQPASESEIPPMLAYVHPGGPEASLVRRVDTAELLLVTSLQLAKLPSIEEVGNAEAASPFAHARKVAYPEGMKPRTTITRQDCLVGENVMVQEKTSIKECVIGANCQIQEGAKLAQCLLMDGVVVGKNCRLTKCILGKRSEVGEGSVLTECEVQENLLVEPKTDAKGEKLMSSSGLEATEEELRDAMDMSDAGAASKSREGSS